MTQRSDIILNGDPYMLVADRGRDGYTRSQDGIDEGRTGRVVQTDFFGGVVRALQLERDRGWSGLAIGPALGGQGVQPWGSSTSVAMPAGTATATTAMTFPHALIGDYVFFAVGTKLYRTVATTTSSWSTPLEVFDAGVGKPIAGIAWYGENILLTFGATREVTHVLYPGATSPTVLFAGEYGGDIVSYQGYAIWADARPIGSGYPNQLRMVTGTGIQFRWVDSPIRKVTTAQGSVCIATSTAIATYSGRVAEVTVPNTGTKPPDNMEVLRWTGDVTPFFQHGTATAADDFAFILGFGGHTYAWLGGMVLEHDPAGARAGWRDTGLHGARCSGAAVAAGYLVVSVVTAQGTSEVWAWDGGGWWPLIRTAYSGSNEWLRPIALGGAGGYDIALPRNGSSGLTLLRLTHRSASAHAYPATEASYVSSMIDAGERDKLKAWRKLGAVFAAPELTGNQASIATHTLALDYSLDGGGAWQLGMPETIAGNSLAEVNTTIERSLASAAAVSPFVQVRVRWAGGLDYAPVLVGLWAEFEALDAPARRRRWSFTVQAQDQVLDRDGEQLTRTGREMIAELWDHWQEGTTVPFRDVDYDDAPVERQVRIVGITEAVPLPLPHEAGLWGQSAIALTLVEI